MQHLQTKQGKSTTTWPKQCNPKHAMAFTVLQCKTANLKVVEVPISASDGLYSCITFLDFLGTTPS